MKHVDLGPPVLLRSSTCAENLRIHGLDAAIHTHTHTPLRAITVAVQESHIPGAVAFSNGT